LFVHFCLIWESAIMAKILCVDDEPDALAMKQTILERAGHSVYSCSSADDAMALLDREPFDAVVTDWNLGESSGRQIVLAAKGRTQVPVVVVSGYCTDAFHAAEPQADIYLEKPVDAEELVAILQALLPPAQHDGHKKTRRAKKTTV
jgi:DNA-binding response OmpR family regulator